MLVVKPTPAQIQKADQIATGIFKDLSSKRDVEEIAVNGIVYGDLIYDDFMRSTMQPTIDISDESFKTHLANFIQLVVYWEDYFDTRDIKAVHVSHCVYKQAIISRLAIDRDIPSYHVNASHAYRLNAQNKSAYHEFFDYPELFKSLSHEQQNEGLGEAKKRLERRFAGEVGVDMRYSSKSAYSGEKHEQLLDTSTRKKVLIATHCFFDSPHPYGISLFPDFYEWMTSLGEISNRTDYDWYIKTHPDVLAGNHSVIKSFMDKYPRFKLLPRTASHHQLIEEGLDVALTVHGTIGIEYAALGIPVINASTVNPHCRYNFNITPKTPDEYVWTIENLDKLNLSIDKNEVFEFYFMKNIYFSENWLFDDFYKMVSDLGGYKNHFKPEVYDYFLNDFTEEKHHIILAALNKFVESGQFRMNPDYMKS